MDKNKKLKFVFLVLVIIIIICILLSKNIDEYAESLDISNNLGQEYLGGELTSKEFMILAQGTVGVYYNYLKQGEYEKAYDLFTPEYQSYESSGEYIERTSKTEIKNFSVNDIVQKTEYMYEAYCTIDGLSSETVMIFLKDDEFALAPGEFIDYKKLDLESEKSGLLVKLFSSKIEVLNCDLKLQFENKKKDEYQISSIKMITTDGKEVKFKNEGFIVEPGGVLEVDASFNTEIDFPKEVVIEASLKGKTKTITFEI